MLSKKSAPDDADQGEDHDQGYGDLTELNRDGIILKSIGHERLKSFATDYLELLGTSSAIYEGNGDYAFGIFASGYCRMMDGASRKLCDTPDNVEAFNSGRWLCHESCRTDCSQKAITNLEQVDIECNGGIRIYAVPIFAGGNVIGAINFGYGDPPKDPEKLKMLADVYHLNYDDLLREATAYESRPPYIIEMAKKRLNSTAKLIGSMVETKQAMEALRQSENQISSIFRSAPVGIGSVVNRVLTKVNNRLCEMTGYDDTEMIGQSSRILYPSDEDFEFVGRGKYAQIADHGTGMMETRWQKKDGTIMDVLLSSTPVNLQDHSRGVTFTALDITNRKQAEEQLIESESLFRGMFKDHSAVMLLIDPDTGQIIKANQAAVQYYGYPLEKILQMKIQQLNMLSPEQITEQMQYALNKQINIFEFRHLLSGGLVRDVEVHSAPITIQHQKLLFSIIRDITERQRAEDAVRKQEVMHGKMLANIGDVIVIIDQEGINRYKSPNIEKLFGWKPEEVVGENTWDNVHPDDIKSTQKFFEKMMHTPDAVGTIECRYRCKDGTYKWIEFTGSNLLDDPDLQGILGNYKDITERKQAEIYREMGLEIFQILNEPCDLQESIQRVLAALKTRAGVDAVDLRLQEGEDFPYFVQDGFSRNFLLTENTLLERGNDGGVCRDKDGNVRLECTCGLVISDKTDPSSLLFTQGGSCWTNDSFPLLDLPSDQDPRMHPRNNCIHQGYASVALIPVRTSDRIVGLIQLKDKRKGRFTLETIEMLEGIATHVGSALMRKQAEEDLKKSLSLIDVTMNSLEEGLLVVNREGEIIRHNRAFLDLWKIPPELESSSDKMLLEHVISQLVDPVAFLSKVRQLYDEPEASSFNEIALADGRVFERYSRPQWQGSQITGRVWCFKDITGRKQAEAEKEKLQAHLTQALKMESVGRLAGGVAHDFNNMLGVILGHVEFALEKTEENHDLYPDLKEIQNAAKRSADITKQLLAFARKEIISPKQLDLNDTVESMLNMLRRLIGEDINLVWKPSAHLWPVKMDPSQIDQTLVNLCVNARDAIAGVGKLTIETGMKTFDPTYCADHEAFIPGDFVMLAVSDDGCGMDKEALNNLFEPFFTTKNIGKGTGLGLSTVYGIVKQNNG
ncbi:MAG: PAS domain S-box protein, partial [Candidatus Desulfacyla sp.]